MSEANSSSAIVSPARIDRAESAVDAYKKVEPKILALSAGEAGRVTADVAYASSIALGARNNLETLRPAFAGLSEGPQTLAALDALPDYALAAFYTHVQSMPAGDQAEILKLVERGKPVKEKLLKVADALVSFGVFEEKTVSAIREGSGNIDLAKDLVALGALFGSNWDRLSNQVPFDIDLVEEASMLGPQLLRAIGTREVGDVRDDPSLDWVALRARAFRLLVNAYEELRRATAYVRWYKNDAAVYTPSLHKRTVARRGTPEPEPMPHPEPEPLAPEPASLFAAVDAVPAEAPEVEVGHRGSNPFTE